MDLVTYLPLQFKATIQGVETLIANVFSFLSDPCCKSSTSHVISVLHKYKCPPSSLFCQGDRWKGEAVVPSSFLPANVSSFNMFAIHKATPIEEDQVMAKNKMKKMELMLAITMPMTILVITKKQMIKVEQMFFYCWIQFVCVEISLCYIPKVDDNDDKRLFIISYHMINKQNSIMNHCEYYQPYCKKSRRGKMERSTRHCSQWNRCGKACA